MQRETTEVQDSSSVTGEERRQQWVILIGVMVIYVVVWHIQVYLQWLGIEIGPHGPPSIMVWNWLAVAAVGVFVILIERRSLSSIGLGRPKPIDFVWAILFWLVALVTTAITHTVSPPPPSEGMDTMLELTIPVLIGVILTASITEEIIYRGFLIERIRELSGYLWVGALVSFTLFVYPHVQFFGPQWLLYHSHVAILIYVLYLWRRNLWSCMLLHVMYNSLILLPAVGID